MAFDGARSARRRPSVAEPKAFIVIAEDHGDLFTVWQTCLANDTVGLTCPHALHCDCERHASGPTLRAEVRSYDTLETAHACADALNEPLLFEADGRARPGQPRPVPPATRQGSKGDDF